MHRNPWTLGLLTTAALLLAAPALGAEGGAMMGQSDSAMEGDAMMQQNGTAMEGDAMMKNGTAMEGDAMMQPKPTPFPGAEALLAVAGIALLAGVLRRRA